MRYRRLGESPLEVSEIAFGCMSLGGDQAASARLLCSARDAGINLFDTADLYDRGRNEETVGRALASRRQEVLLATKVGNQWNADGEGWSWNPRREYILHSVEDSLRRLRTDYIDLYQLHGGTIEDPIDETIEAFELLRQQGKIRAWGISSIRPNVHRQYLARSRAASVMVQYSLLDRRQEESCLSALAEHGRGVLVRGALATGLLVGKPPRAYLGRARGEVAAAAAAIAAVSGPQRSPVQTTLRFVLDRPEVSCAVVGLRTTTQLEECLGAVEAPSLTAEERQTLEQAAPARRYDQHR